VRYFHLHTALIFPMIAGLLSVYRTQLHLCNFKPISLISGHVILPAFDALGQLALALASDKKKQVKEVKLKIKYNDFDQVRTLSDGRLVCTCKEQQYGDGSKVCTHIELLNSIGSVETSAADVVPLTIDMDAAVRKFAVRANTSVSIVHTTRTPKKIYELTCTSTHCKHRSISGGDSLENLVR